MPLSEPVSVSEVMTSSVKTSSVKTPSVRCTDHDRHNSSVDVRYFCSRKHIRPTTHLDFSVRWYRTQMVHLKHFKNTFVNYWTINRIVYFDSLSIRVFFNSTKVYIEQDMHSPAELHDKCNREELSPELKCHLIDAFLTCRPLQCGNDDRFRCDCNVYNHGWVRDKSQHGSKMWINSPVP